MTVRMFVLLGISLLFLSVSSVSAMEVTVSPMIGGYVFDSDLDLKNSPVYSLGVGLNLDRTWSVEGFADYAEADRDGSSSKVNYYSGRLGVLYHLEPMENFTPYLMAGVGALRVMGNDDGQFTYGIGTKLGISETVALRLEARHVVGIEIDKDTYIEGAYNNFAFGAGLVLTLGELQEAPVEHLSQVEEPAKEEPVVVEQAKPEPVKPVEDSDNDGVIDVLDRCPVTPEGTQVDAEGCPAVVKFVDSDSDGVSDVLDSCPDTPAGVDVDLRGCPLPDSDGDGVIDTHDKCPGTESQLAVDAEGCPELSEKLKIAGLVIEYSTSQTGFSEEAARELKILAAKIKSTDQGRLVVEGHTDSVGSTAYNTKLSQERADKVRMALINDFGVSADRVVAKGYGPFEPVATNSTQEGRQQNRRVVVRYEP